VYRVDPDAVVIAEVFKRKSTTTPQSVIDLSRKRLREYDDA
jgi:phage-related protein